VRSADLRLRRHEAQSEDTRDTAAGAEIVVSAGEAGEIAPDAIDDVDARLLSLLLAGSTTKPWPTCSGPRCERFSGG